MNKETLKKIFLPLIVLVIIIQIWSGIATYIPGFPTPSDTYVYAFGGTTGDGEELKGVLSDPFYSDHTRCSHVGYRRHGGTTIARSQTVAGNKRGKNFPYNEHRQYHSGA